LTVVRQEVDKYDPLFDAIRRKEPREEVKEIWDNIRPKGFFRDAFLLDIRLSLDRAMVEDYKTALSKLKQELQGKDNSKEEREKH